MIFSVNILIIHELIESFYEVNDFCLIIIFATVSMGGDSFYFGEANFT